MAETQFILGIAVAVGLLTFIMASLAPLVPGLDNQLNGTENFGNISQERQELGQLNNSSFNSDSMIFDSNFSASPTGEAIYWDNTTNDRGDEYGYVQYNVTGLTQLEVRSSGAPSTFSFFPPLRYYYSNSSNGTYYSEGAFFTESTTLDLVVDSTADQTRYGEAGIRYLEIRDYGNTGGELYSFARPATSPGVWSQINAMFSLSSNKTWFQYLVGIPLTIVGLYIGLRFVPFIGS